MKAITKNMLAFALTVSMVATPLIAGCKRQQQGDPEPTGAEEIQVVETEDGTQKLLGAWKVYDGTSETLSEGERALFDSAIETFDVSYTPIAIIGTQVVAGTNYAYLCRTADDGAWAIVVVYVNLDGEAQVTNIADFDIDTLEVYEGVNPSFPGLAGGWTIQRSRTTELEPDEAAAAFGQAMDGYEGLEVTPIATLGTQLVSGTNYLILCSGTPDDANVNDLYLVQVYAPLSGDAELTSIDTLPLTPYVSISDKA